MTSQHRDRTGETWTPPSRGHLIGLLALVVAILASTTAIGLYHDFQETWRSRSALVRDMARVVEDHSYRTVRSADAGLKLVETLVRSPEDLGAANHGPLRTALLEIAAGIEGSEPLLLFDRAGNLVSENGHEPSRAINIADRPYFQAAVAGEALYVGPAIINRLTDRIVFTVSRRLIDPDGNFLGIASVAIDATRLTDFYDLFSFDLDPLVGIYRRDGAVVARRPDLARFIGGSIATGPLRQQLEQSPNGVYLSVSALDGRERLAAYRSVRDYPLVVVAGIEREVMLRSWRSRAMYAGGLTMASGIAILAALVWGWNMVLHQRRTRTVLARAIESRDVTARKLELARRDPLTGIAGRALFVETTDTMIRRAAGDGTGIGLLFIDLDGFKGVNDRLGHDAGDRVLQAASAAITRCLRDRDVAGRLGGDEFGACVVASRAQLGEILGQIGTRIVAEIGRIGDGIGCSVGIATATDGTLDAAQLLRNADAAMYAAKRAGKNRYVRFDALEKTAA